MADGKGMTPDVAMQAPEPLTLAEHIPPASIVPDFVMELPGLVANIPGNVSEMIGALSERLPAFDREAG